MKHRGLTMIKAGTPQYTIVKTIAKHVMEFYEEYEAHFTSSKAAALEYIKIANSIMKNNFNITRIPSLHERIVNTMHANIELKEDRNIQYTDRAYKRYIQKVIQMTGSLIDDPKERAEDFVNFVKVAKRCEQLSVTPEVYIEAQFFGLEFCNGIPSPQQLMGDKSLTYLQRYKLSDNYKAEAEPAKDIKLVNKFKDILSR